MSSAYSRLIFRGNEIALQGARGSTAACAAAPCRRGGTMTVLGKILAFLNLAFALTVGGFIVVDFATRTNWHDAYNKLRDEMKVAKANWDVTPETFAKL